MRRNVRLLALFLWIDILATPPRTAAATAAREDGASVDTILTALYESVSHGPEAEPDWDRMRKIFLPAGILVPPRRPGDDALTVLTVEGFAERARKGMAARKAKGEPVGFFERETARRTDCFGNVCQVFSTYEGRSAPSDPSPFVRGINSIQLARDGSRWWIVSVAWDSERADNPIPPAYRPGGAR
jgi:hypothetical protein